MIPSHSDDIDPSNDSSSNSSSDSSSDGGARTWRGVKLPSFEGPLDLLLHLIRTNEVDVSDIPIAKISEQYLEYLEVMKLLDIDVAAEYLVMAATLAYIKSRMLLPVDPEAEDGEGEDPRAELARRLAEYAVFKEVAVELGGRPWLGRDVFGGHADRSELPARETELAVELNDLINAMRRVLADLPKEVRHHEVTRERVTAQDRMLAVMDHLQGAGDAAILFEDLLRDVANTRNALLMTFLAILELAKIQALRIFQNTTPEGQPHGPIRVRLAISTSLETPEALEEAEAGLPETEGTVG